VKRLTVNRSGPADGARLQAMQHAACITQVSEKLPLGRGELRQKHGLQETASFLRSYSSPAIQKIPHILWNPKAHYHIHNSPPFVPILSQMKPVHASHAIHTTHFNSILLSTPRSCKWSLSLGSTPRNPRRISLSSHMRHNPLPILSPSFEE
jgi:hypothetical protein